MQSTSRTAPKYIISLNEWLEIYLISDTPAHNQSAPLAQGNIQYPIGTIYTSTTSTNPSRSLGGKWAAEGSTQLASSGLTAYIWRRTE